jgi:uncharacterized repeat protein (TIGR04076 family)
MKRREFLEKTGYGATGFVAAPLAQGAQKEKEPLVVRSYDIEIEVFEEGPKTRCHKKGEKYKWPDERGGLCTWLTSAMDPIVTTMARGGTLPWKYEGTPYEKVIDLEGVTTEFVRCPDPSEAGIVVKITRTFKSKRTIEV